MVVYEKVYLGAYINKPIPLSEEYYCTIIFYITGIYSLNSCFQISDDVFPTSVEEDFSVATFPGSDTRPASCGQNRSVHSHTCFFIYLYYQEIKHSKKLINVAKCFQ